MAIFQFDGSSGGRKVLSWFDNSGLSGEAWTVLGNLVWIFGRKLEHSLELVLGDAILRA